MNITYTLATTKTNTYGYAVPIETLEKKVKSLNENHDFLILENHDMTKPISIKILNSELVWREDLDAHAIVIEFELPEGFDEESFVKRYGKAMSMSFSDKSVSFGAAVERSDIEFIYDEYRTNKLKLETDMIALSKKLKMPIVCHNIRRHADPGTVLTYVGLKVAEHLVDKVLTDINLYGILKKELLGISTVSASGKEANIKMKKTGRIRIFRFTGKTDEELNELIDLGREYMQALLEEPLEPTDEIVIYNITKHQNGLTCAKTKKKFNSSNVL